MSELTSLPPEVLQNHVAFLATSDAGKTYAAKTAIEDLLDAGARACIIDPKGVWYGMRLQPGGRKASRYQLVIFGGDHADVPLDGVSGARLAQVIAEGDFSAIIDTRRLTVGQRTRLFADFAEGLSQFNSRALHLVIDEAHLFAPQGRVQDFDSGRMVHAANELVSGGRSLGLRVMLLSQRPAKLHKDSLSQVQTLVAMMNMGPQDRKAVADWIKDQADAVRGKEILASLPSLQVGHGWVWSPRRDILEPIHFRRLKTFDSSATPADGAPRTPTVPLSSSDLAGLRKALAPPPAETPIAATTSPGARKKVADPPPNPGAFEQALKTGYDDGFAGRRRAGFEEGYAEGIAEGRLLEWTRLSERLGQAIATRLGGAKYLLEQDLYDAGPDSVAAEAEGRTAPTLAKTRSAPRSPPPVKPRAAEPVAEGGLTSPQQELLTALSWWAAAGHTQPTRPQLVAILGWKLNGSHLRNTLGSLRTLGLIDYPAAKRVGLTAYGETAATPDGDGRDLKARIRASLSAPQALILDLLLKTGGEMSRRAIAAELRWEEKGSHMRNTLGSLSSMEIVSYPGVGRVKLQPWVSEGAR